MSFERYHLLWKEDKNGKVLRPKKEGVDFAFSFSPKEGKLYRLFTVGQTNQFYQWKNEPDGPMQYALLDDCLDTEHAVNSHYCLNFSSKKPESYVRRIHKFILWPPKLSFMTFHELSDDLEMGLSAAAENLVIHEGGYLRMRVEVRYKREGFAPASVAFPPELIYQLDLPEGSYEMTAFTKAITIPKDKTASIAVWIEGVHYQGTLYVEAPVLRCKETDLLPDFSLTVPYRDHYHWSGQYFGRKEWPEFRVTLNGQVIHEGEIFERSHVLSEWELEVPAHLLGKENTLTYELISDYHDPLPYSIHEFGLIEREGGAVVLVSATKTAKVGGKAYILLRTAEPNTKVTLSVDPACFEAKTEFFFEEAGLHGIPLKPLKAGEDLPFTVTYEGGSLSGTVGRIAEGENDDVRVGTGDMIYIKQDPVDMEEYLSWYLSNQVGTLITIRPAYRWSGTRVIDPEVWRVFTRLMEETDTAYVLMLDGREAEGLACSPDEQQLAGPCYKGPQSHEVDGALAYWGAGRMDDKLSDLQMHNLWMRIADEDPDHVFSRWTSQNLLMSDGDKLYRHRNPNRPRDMKDGADYMIERLQQLRLRETRNTGPAALFKYFIQAGFSWVGAETMYTSMEPILSFLRGTKNAYRLPAVGVHHALQWCHDFHNTPAQYRRYRLALYTAYLLGIDEINTEEGLWRIEHHYTHYHRFSSCLNAYLKEHQDFYRYLTTHTRKGTFHTPIAFLHGRYDGFTQSSGSRLTWGWRAANGMPSGAFPEANNSWDLLKIFYPLCLPAGGPTRYATENKPTGCYSGTPLGQVDTLPVEEDAFSAYRTLAFVGYNCAEDQDFDRLARYVEEGGRLLLSRAHMTVTTDLSALNKGDFTFGKTPFSFAEGEPQFKETTYQGISVPVCTNYEKEGLLSSVNADDGTPLLCRYAFGKGEVLLLNAPVYPAHPAVKELYAKTLRACAEEEAAKEPLWAETGNEVEFSVYLDQDGTRSLYLLAVDWYNDPAPLRSATLLADGYRYPVELPFGTMIKCLWRKGVAVYCHSEEGEVLSIGETAARVQGTGKCTFTVCKDGKTQTHTVDFTTPTAEISL